MKIKKSINWQNFNVADVKSINTDNLIIADCYNEITNQNNEVVITDRVNDLGFPMTNNIFSLTLGEKEMVKGLMPRIEWLKTDIQFYMTYNNIPFLQSDTEKKLLSLI